MRTKELADKILADCQHTLADFNMEKGDASKLYEVDGVEYDAKGLHELVRKLHAADAEKRSQARLAPNSGGGMRPATAAASHSRAHL
eukprot:6181569-Pleurochrysis_carterae.AAC.2